MTPRQFEATIVGLVVALVVGIPCAMLVAPAGDTVLYGVIVPLVIGAALCAGGAVGLRRDSPARHRGRHARAER